MGAARIFVFQNGVKLAIFFPKNHKNHPTAGGFHLTLPWSPEPGDSASRPPSMMGSTTTDRNKLTADRLTANSADWLRRAILNIFLLSPEPSCPNSHFVTKSLRRNHCNKTVDSRSVCSQSVCRGQLTWLAMMRLGCTCLLSTCSIEAFSSEKMSTFITPPLCNILVGLACRLDKLYVEMYHTKQ